MAKAPPSIAATSTLAMIRAAEARGAAIQDLLDQAGWTRSLIEDPDARLAGPVVLGFWNALRARLGDPALQLTAPLSLPFGAYRVIDYMVAASPTVGEGIEHFAQYFRLIADAVTLATDATGDPCTLTLALPDGAPVPPVYVDYVFAALVLRIRMRICPDLAVSRIELRQPPPTYAERYREVFGAPVRFGAPSDQLQFSQGAWTMTTATGDAALARLLEDHAQMLARRLPRAPAGILADVEGRILAKPADGAAADAIARSLNMSVRTLQRKLVHAGTTFADLSSHIRHELAMAYLRDPAVSITEVAFLLGFSDETAFNRAFRRWTGEPPGRWRRVRNPAGPAGSGTDRTR